MADDRQSGGGIPGTNWVLLAVAAISAAYIGLKKPPLDVLRPAAPDRAIHGDRGVQDVTARLWQDPLAAVSQSAQDEEKDATQAIDQSAHSIFGLKKGVQEKAGLILGVSLNAAPYAEEAEGRRRSRYAVLAALNAAKYVPDDEEHIGYVRADSLARGPLRTEWNQPGLNVSLDVKAANKQQFSGNDSQGKIDVEKSSLSHTVIPFE